MRRRELLAWGALSVFSRHVLRAQAAPIVNFFVDGIWLNLHHFLYVLGRAQANFPDSKRDGVNEAPADQERGLAGLDPAAVSTWRDAVTFYVGGLSKADAVSSRDLVTVAGALARAGDAATLGTPAGVPADVATMLTRAAPIYRKAWWPAHHDANRRWAAEMRPMVDRYGAEILAFLTKVYQLPWPAAGYPVQVSGYTNWAGAYSTTGPLLMIASLDKGNGGQDGLEIVFHESMHQWDEPVLAKLRDFAAGKRLSPNLTHALIWMTAGEAIRRVLPDHVPIAERGIWERADYPKLKLGLEAAWLPYLKGQGTRDEALEQVVRLTAR